MRPLSHFWKKAQRDESGVVTVELALFATLMMLVAIPVFDLARTIYDSMRLTAAMRAGMYYAYKVPTDTAGIEEVLRTATPLDSAQMSVTNIQFCECGGVVIECTATCTDSKATYLNLTADYEVPLNADYPELGNAYVLSKTSTLRIQ